MKDSLIMMPRTIKQEEQQSNETKLTSDLKSSSSVKSPISITISNKKCNINNVVKSSKSIINNNNFIKTSPTTTATSEGQKPSTIVDEIFEKSSHPSSFKVKFDVSSNVVIGENYFTNRGSGKQSNDCSRVYDSKNKILTEFTSNSSNSSNDRTQKDSFVTTEEETDSNANNSRAEDVETFPTETSYGSPSESSKFKSRPQKVVIKQEDPQETQIEHRKSSRRRIARDIFFIFEEHPKQRKGRACGTAVRKTGSVSNKRPVRKPLNKPEKSLCNNKKPNQSRNIKPNQNDSEMCSNASLMENNKNSATKIVETTVPRVNPIFLWVKQDESRIVEVRCEDYDKRNRIKLTKTANGWRAMPRTDTSTSRVAKLLPNPLLKVKQELALSNVGEAQHVSHTNSDTAESKVVAPLRLPLLKNGFVEDVKRSKKKKKKKKKEKRSKCEIMEDTNTIESLPTFEAPKTPTPPPDEILIQQSIPFAPPPVLDGPPNDVVIYESTNHERNEDEMLSDQEPNIGPVIKPHLPSSPSPLRSPSLLILSEMNNNRATDEHLVKQFNHHVLPDPIDLDLFSPDEHAKSPEICESILTLCPETGVFLCPNRYDSHDADTKHLKDLLDDADLLQHCDNAMSGSDIIDSLVKRGCETTNISDDEPNIPMQRHQSLNSLRQNNNNNHHQNTHTVGIPSDFDNEDDDILELEQEPVEDIISRLGDSLAASPKCLSFNEAGEIEGLHGELFHTSNQNDVFNRNPLDELSITIKDLEKSSDNVTPTKRKACYESVPSINENSTGNNNSNNTTIVLSPDSCLQEAPKDLTCKSKSDDELSAINIQFSASVCQPQQSQTPNRPQSNSQQQRPSSISSSETIQSPQPSGLPAVLQSPGAKSKMTNSFLDQLMSTNTSSSSSSPSSKNNINTVPSVTIRSVSNQQKEPLDLGKHRKSASPTVTCSSEEVKSIKPRVENSLKEIGEPKEKRIKTETALPPSRSHTKSLIELLASGKDPDPLTQLRLLVSNPEWKVPDPILVPKDRLNAVLASPAREIPLLLTTRPELRLPEAFAYPAILTDPDILVISTAQLETILQKQAEMANLKTQFLQQFAKDTPSSGKNAIFTQSDLQANQKQATQTANPLSGMNPLNAFLPGALGNDIDAATLAAFNQMLWLPYLGKMAPDLFKSAAAAAATLTNGPSLAEMIPLLAQQQQQHQHQSPAQRQNTIVPNPMALQNHPLELAMWQDVFNQTQLQRNFKQSNPSTPTSVTPTHREKSKVQSANVDNKLSQQADFLNSFNFANMLNLSQQVQQHQQPTKQERLLEEFKRQQLLQQEAMKQRQNTSLNPLRQEQNRNSFRQQQSHDSKNCYATEHSSSEIQQKKKKSQSSMADQKPRVTCKSLMNLLQPERLAHQSDIKVPASANLISKPSLFDFNIAAAAAATVNSNPYQNTPGFDESLLNQFDPRFNNQFAQYQRGGGHASVANSMNSAASYLNSVANNNTGSKGQHQSSAKLKVKPGAHLFDPAAIQRRLLNCEESPEITPPTPHSLDEANNDFNASLWHPLFGSAQKQSYASPWQWTTVTATGE